MLFILSLPESKGESINQVKQMRVCGKTLLLTISYYHLYHQQKRHIIIQQHLRFQHIWMPTYTRHLDLTCSGTSVWDCAVLRLWAGLEDELHLPEASDGTAVSAAASAQDAVALADADAGTPASAPTHTHGDSSPSILSLISHPYVVPNLYDFKDTNISFCSPLNKVIKVLNGMNVWSCWEMIFGWTDPDSNIVSA